MKLKVSFYTQLKTLFDLLFISTLFGVGLYYLNIYDRKVFLYIILPYVLIFVIPVICIHLNYYINSVGVSYLLKDDYFIIQKGDEIQKIKNIEVVEITLYMTTNRLLDNALRYLPYEGYYYSKIQLSNNEVLTITSLHSNSIDKILTDNFKGIKVIKMRTFYPIITKN